VPAAEIVRGVVTVEEIVVATVAVAVVPEVAEVAGADGAVVPAAVAADDMAAMVEAAEAGTRLHFFTSLVYFSGEFSFFL
jgi:hypothetical protein